jgi:chemotaxis protein histidine kinase CheA
MSLPIRLAVIAATLMLLTTARQSAAADQKAAIDKIKGHVTEATTAFTQKNFEKMKTELGEAVTTGNENELGTNPLMAKVYVLLGVMEITGFKNTKEGVAHFVKALEISPAVQVPVNMTSKPVRTAFAKAEDQDASSTAQSEKAAAAEPEKAAPAAESKKAETAKAETAKAEPVKAETTKADPKAEAKARAEAEKAEKAAEKTRAEQAKKELAEKDVLQKEKDKLQKDKQEKDSQLADTKGRLQQIEKDKAEKDKQLAATKDSEKKEREAKEKVSKEKQDVDKQLADAKARVQQLEKEKAEKDKQLAAVQDSEKKEREAKEKLEKVRQELEARETARKGREAADKQDRDAMAEGPALPGHVSEPIHCTMPDEISAGVDLYVHCVPRSNVSAKTLVLYYRPGNAVLYNSLTMERSKKGWYVATIPGGRIGGKLLHYYVEARDDKAVIVGNGQAGSPNIATVKTGGAPVARVASASTPAPSTGAAVADSKPQPSHSARRSRTKERAKR